MQRVFSSWRLGLLVLFALALSPAASLGGEARYNRLSEAFLITLPLSVQGDSEEEARLALIAVGQRRALSVLVSRFVLPEEEAEEAARALPEGALNALISEVVLENLKYAPPHLSAALSVRFDREAVFSFLSQSNLSVAYAVSPSFLLVPILLQEEERLLWPPDNAWLATWQSQDYDKEWLVPITPIQGERGERLAILDALRDPNSVQASLLTDRYQAEGLVVITAFVEVSEETGLSTLRLEGHLTQKHFPQTLPTMTLQQSPSEDLTALLVRARHRALYAMNLLWKRHAASAARKKPNRVRLIALLQNRSEWTTLQKTLSAIPSLTRYDLRSLSARRVHVIAEHYSTLEIVIEALGRKGLYSRKLDNHSTPSLLLASRARALETAEE